MTGSLSDFANNPIGKGATTLDASPQFDGYSRVEIIVDEDHSITAGDTTGRTLTIQNPWGTQAQANAILASIRGYQYQPYTSSGALLSPAAEIGDAVTINGLYSGVYKMSKTFSSLMKSDIAAPQDEAIDHEYPFETKGDRIYQRELADTRASISVASDAITAEVTRATNAESSLSSQLTIQASQISAKVSQENGSWKSFGWNLNTSGWSVWSNSTKVVDITSSGLKVDGKITARSGYIGNGSSGFTITANAIYNGVTSMSDTAHTGVYVGTNGIRLGKGVFSVNNSGAVTASNITITGGSISIKSGNTETFKVTNTGAVTASNITIKGGSITIGNNFSVTSAGNVTANNMTLKGTLTVGGATITADQLRIGAAQAYSGYGGWNGATNLVNANSGTWTAGAGGGIAFNDASTQNGSYRSFFRASVINCDAIYTMNNFWGLSNSGIKYDQWTYVPKTKVVVTGISGQSVVQDIYGNTQYVVRSLATTTLYYLGRSDIA